MFWFGAGVAAGVALTRKVSETTKKATPTGMAEQVGGAVRELAVAVGSFGAEVRAGMQEREGELHDVVGNPDAVQVRRFDAETGSEARRARRAGR
jgi:chromosome condensin MukBEF MukE localization factor